MKDELTKKISALYKEVAEFDELLAKLFAEQNNLRADQELNRPGSDPHARATARINEIESAVWDISRKSDAKMEAIEGLKGRLRILDDPDQEKATDKTVAEALAARAKIDPILAKVATTTKKLRGHLEDLARLEAQIRDLHHSFDMMQLGRSSTMSWIDDQLSVFSGKGAYPIREGRPASPGTYYPVAETLEREIRQTALDRAARKLKRVFSGE